jgi:hypothetical protein
MSEEEDDESLFFVFIAGGVMFLIFGASDLVLSDSPQSHSWVFVVSGFLFFVAAFLTRYEDFGGFLDLG